MLPATRVLCNIYVSFNTFIAFISFIDIMTSSELYHNSIIIQPGVLITEQ